MPTPQERLNAAIKYFFEEALPHASGKPFDKLPHPLVHAGAYTTYSGPAVPAKYGQSVTPKYVLRVHPPLPAAGSAAPQVAAEVPQTGGLERHVLYMRQAADHKVDTEDEIRRVLADLDSFNEMFNAERATSEEVPGDGAGGGSAQPPAAAATASAGARAGDWARAIIAARGSIPDDLTTLTTVPQPLASLAADAEALRTVLAHFFTFDGTGKYYARWAGAGRDASNAAHLTPEYKRENVRELQLERECLYLYTVLPQSLLAAGGGLDASAFREIVFRFDQTPEAPRPFWIAAVHTAQLRLSSAPFCDFVFVYTKEGTGIQQLRDSRQKMSPALQSLLAELDEPGADREAILSARPYSHKTDGEWYITLTVRLEGDAALPAGALTGEELREWNAVTAPIGMVGELAALSSVTYMGVTSPARPSLDLARAEVNFPALDAKIAADKRGGKGVVVGIIDTGIDGSHPAFGSRIHAVWDQDPPPGMTGKSPKDNNTSKAYANMNWGIELTKSSTPSKVSDSQDLKGHGTHVAGIVAGAEVKDGAGKVLVPAGLAPNATIVAVNAIEPLGVNAKVDWSLGVDYIFLKAKELNLPCVINMSFGHHHHGHDGTDPDARKIFEQLTDKKTKAYLPGRVVIAAAGNERNNAPMHVRRSIGKAGMGSYKVMTTVSLGSQIAASKRVTSELVAVWIKNPSNSCPKSFPVGLVVFRWKTAATYDITLKVMLGDSKWAGSFPALNTRIAIASQAAEHVNGDYAFTVAFAPIDSTKTMVRADWNIVMDNQVNAPLDVHMWLIAGQSHFKDATASEKSHLVGSPADGASAISVAACVSKLSWTDSAGAPQIPGGGHTLHDIAAFSSMGPLRDASIPVKKIHGVAHEVNAVDITAPGCFTLGALSSQWAVPSDELWLKANNRGIHLAGTSMASPLVTGLVANLLAEDDKLTMPAVLTKLKNAASIPAASKLQPPAATGGAKPLSQDWGYGLVDAGKLK